MILHSSSKCQMTLDRAAKLAEKRRMIQYSTVPDPPGVLTLHASAVQMNGGALIFLGPTKTGKTTVCKLLSAQAPRLADDVVRLIQANGAWETVDAGRRGHLEPLSEQEAAVLHGVPLRAILRLYQAPAPRLVRIDEVKMCYYLVDSFFDIVRQRDYALEVKRPVFANLAALARSIPGYEFYFDRSPQTLHVLAGELGLW